MNRRRWTILVMFLLAAALCTVLLLIFRPDSHETNYGNLLRNGDFESLDSNGQPQDWYSDAWINTPGYTQYDIGGGISGNGAHILNNAANDARFAQSVRVEPNAVYCLRGFIRADAAGGLGANLSIEGIYIFSESVYDTKDEWVEVALYGMTGTNQKNVIVFARLGGYSGEATGEAWFDNLSLCRVDSVPSGYYTYSWFVSSAESSAEDTQSDTDGRSAWPWFLLIALLYILLCAAFVRFIARAEETEKADGRSVNRAVIAALAAALLSRLAVAALIPGYGVDIGCFRSWASRMASEGPALFYSTDAFCDYPPGYMLVLGILGWIGKLFGTGVTEMMVKMPSILCDIGVSALIYAFALKYTRPRAAAALSMLYAFNPLTFVAGAAWGQADSVMTLVLLLTVTMAIRRKWKAVLPLYVFGVLLKPQMLMFGPLGLAVIVIEILRRREKKEWRDALIGLAYAAAVALAVILPFSGKMNDPFWIVKLYTDTMGYYANATVNACNLYFLFGKNWAGIADKAPLLLKCTGFALLIVPLAVYVIREKVFSLRKNPRLAALSLIALAAAVCVFLPLSYKTLSSVYVGIIILSSALLYLKGGSLRHLPLLGALMLLALGNLGVMMHERYLFAAVPLLLLACVLEKDRRLYRLLAFLTAAVLINVGCVLDRGIRIGGSAGHLDAPLCGIDSDSALIEYIAAAMNCMLTSFSVFIALSLCSEHERILPLPVRKTGTRTEKTVGSESIRSAAIERASDTLLHPGADPSMKRKDWLLVLTVTAVYALAAFINLGSTVSPQTFWTAKSAGEEAVIDLKESKTFQMLYLGGIHATDSDFGVSVSEDGIHWSDEYAANMDIGNCFQWQYLVNTSESADSVLFSSIPRELTGRFVKITAHNIGLTLFEVILRDPDGVSVLDTSLVSAQGKELIDEANTFFGNPNWYNSAYFDEIYHARTAYEHYRALLGDTSLRPYETSHPPLGKLLMTFSIFLFGMTPFGWRFAGALAGVLMLPGIYLLAKSLTKRRFAAFGAMFLLAVDCMHFAQTRIATIDSFVVLFIIWSMVFMIRYARMDYYAAPFWKTLGYLALSGLFMGLACASKWTGCYAGLGLAVIFLWSLVRHLVESAAARKILDTPKRQRGSAAQLRLKVIETAKKEGIRRAVWTCASCILFFVAVPAIIYYLSYIPYFMPSGGVTVQKIVDAAKGMYAYHSTPGLGMDHFCYTPWYEWPLSITPMWFFQGALEPEGFAQTIESFGNPAVWWVGFAALLSVIGVWAFRRIGRDRRTLTLWNRTGDMRPALLLLAFAAQYLPWTLVPRGTYIYHYFTSVPFIILCTALVFDLAAERYEKAARRVMGAYLIIALVLFILFFPYISGLMTSTKWLDAMNWFSGWLYY